MLIAVIPAYNEERFIGSVVLKVKKYVDTVMVIDDGSRDLTGEIAHAAGAIVIRHETNRGKGAALNSGFEKARELHAQAVVVLDGDGQHRPEDILAVVTPIMEEKADIVVGSRYLQFGSRVPFHRIIGHKVFTSVTNLLSGIRVTDSQSGFRAFSTKALNQIRFKSTGFSVESEMQFLAVQNELRLLEVPIVIRYSDRPKRSVLHHGITVLNGILRLIGQNRPLLFIGIPGFLTLLVGIIWGGWVVEIFREKQSLAIGYALLSVLLSIIGTLAMFVGIILHSIRGLLREFHLGSDPSDNLQKDFTNGER
jgi:glycosyltransferase involved in cell wall biosynthesis